MKKLISLIAAITIAFSVLAYCPANASEKSTYIKKIVSLVYDDSGSMKGDKWAYANYAVQTFCGMLNSEDQLYITYMSRAQLQPGYKPELVDLSSGGIQESVDTLRNHDEDMDTPFKSVQLAFDKLCEIDCKDENAQYWLVVITDGVFDEIAGQDDSGRKKYLNEKFTSYAGVSMPNGSRLQTNFLSIGQAIAPDHNEKLGIYTYPAATADEIISAMSDMAHKVSGRTRVEESKIVQKSGKTIEIKSSLPLLNIAIVEQKTNAGIKKVKDGKGNKMRISRDVSVSYPSYDDLQGKIYLIGDTKKIMDEGKYEITFDRDVKPEQLVIMLEPALETRIFVEHDGKTYDSISDIEKLSDQDDIIVSYKIYKIGDNKEIPPEQFSEGTKFSLSLYEGDKEVLSNCDSSMTLKKHTLSKKEVRIKANVQVKGFNPIGSSVVFVPTQYGSADGFSVKGKFLDENQQVKYSDIASNTSTGIAFTVYKDGKALKDPQKVKATSPEITLSVPGNEGDVSISDDGRIIFIPKKAQLPSPDAEKFNVEVCCKIGGNKTATKEYVVVVSDYLIDVTNDNFEIVKTKFFNNKDTASFRILKNGKQLSKNDFDENFKVDFGKKFKDIKADIKVADDGVITVRPYSQEENKLNFFTWWINWSRYFSLNEGNMKVTLSHELGKSDANIRIVGESIGYQLLNVYLPLLIEIVLLILAIIWIILIITKPRFTGTAKLFVGTVRYNKLKQNHSLMDFSSEELCEYNKIRRGNGRLKFKRDADVVEVLGVNIRAGGGDRIFCEEPQPWYKVALEPISADADTLRTPEQLEQYFSNHRKLEIEEISALEAIDKESAKNMGPCNMRNIKYIVVPDESPGTDKGLSRIDGRLVIKSGKIFIYKD